MQTNHQQPTATLGYVEVTIGVPESNIIFLNLVLWVYQTPTYFSTSYQHLKVCMTSEIDIGLNEDFRVIPGICEFGDQYFGKDDDDEQLESRSW
ncbi:uridine kinase-like protein 4-like [Trifolium pratense]|uniref:Uridine kinase-like protein 4-like n=1 Tax=Trifolium pratense TaxID=57577 RepID=A0A2K3NFM8_TRIPR|nr:uridine kinase-like protein 4-like [Trifolium pratense]PNY01841.1 uridine kinase-like protein 4-like [Trifolium pratense]